MKQPTLKSDNMKKPNSTNLLTIKHHQPIQATYRLTEEMFFRIESFARESLASRTDKISYLIRLFNAVKPDMTLISMSTITRSPKTKRSGSYVPEDIYLIIKTFGELHNITQTSSFEIMINEALTLAKKYSLEVTLVEKEKK